MYSPVGTEVLAKAQTPCYYILEDSAGTWTDGRPLNGLNRVGRSVALSTHVRWTSFSRARVDLS